MMTFEYSAALACVQQALKRGLRLDAFVPLNNPVLSDEERKRLAQETCYDEAAIDRCFSGARRMQK